MTEDTPDTTQAKGAAKPLVRKKPGSTTKTVLPGSADAADMNLPATKKSVSAARLAQMVNLHIGGYSLEQIGDAIGCTPEEVEQMLTEDVSRYVRTQPALRVYVRNWISEKYGKLLEADWDIATDKQHKDRLENQDRVIRILERMSKLHGAEAPVQTEVKIETAPEAVEKLVDALSKQKGLAYDDDVFDTIDAEVIEDVVHETEDALHESEDVSGDEEALS